VPFGCGLWPGLEAAREIIAKKRGIAPAAKAILTVFSWRPLWRTLLTAARWFRATGLPARLANGSRFGFGMGMLAATRQHEKPRSFPTFHVSHSAPKVALFRGCVMDTVFRHVNDATRRVLEANGFVSWRSTARAAAAPCTNMPATAPEPSRSRART
jgi:Fe-S oxidoreductase